MIKNSQLSDILMSSSMLTREIMR